MKKVFVITLVLIFTFSFSIGASDLFENMIDTAEVKYGVEQGKLEYLLKVLEYNYGEAIDDGLDHEVSLHYGITGNTEIYGYMYYLENYKKFIGSIKNNFYNKNGWKLSLKGRYYYLDNYGYEVNTPSFKLYADKKVGKTVFHNSLMLYFYEGGDIGKKLENGITYIIDDKNAIKLLFESFTFDELDDLEYKVKAALESKLNDKVTYTGYMNNDLDEENVYFNNVLEFEVEKGLNLTGQFVINTSESYNNWLKGEVKKSINKDFSLIGQYSREITEDGYNQVMVGFEYKL